MSRETPTQIIERVAKAFCVTRNQLLGRRRHPRLCQARHYAMLEIRRRCPGISLTEIGALFGRDHSTVIHGIRAAQKRIDQARRKLVGGAA